MIENNRETAVHPEATHIKTRRDKILFFKANPTLIITEKRMQPIPAGTNTLIIQRFEPHKYWISYGEITLYSHRGNILNSYKL